MKTITCKRDESDPEFCATHEDGMFDVESVECDEADRIHDHAYLPVAGHPDDPECTHRADGTDATYCGRAEDEHAWSTR
ncbi:hypothetical protein [Microbacterium arborescens]|uniref:hypothetical protein n=1 Tax=Microbacterium arborescens TaxID=33883 RepID=UPI000DF803CE|nr:hypothetical protein [Microbacterium arborescens]